MVDLTINVKLAPDRTKTGILTIVDDKNRVLAGPFDVYSKADNARAAKEGNAARNPLKPYGDTPEGKYSVPRLVDTGAERIILLEAMDLMPRSSSNLNLATHLQRRRMGVPDCYSTLAISGAEVNSVRHMAV